MGGGIVSDVFGESVDVGYDDGFALLGRCPVDVLFDGDSNACYFALEWPQHQIIVAQKIKPDPIYLRKRLKKQHNQINQVCQTIPFTHKQNRELLIQFMINHSFKKTYYKNNNMHDNFPQTMS